MKSGSDVRINIGSFTLPEGGGGGTESVSLASEAAAQSNASSLAQMRREIAELEAQACHPRHPFPSPMHCQRKHRPARPATMSLRPAEWNQSS